MKKTVLPIFLASIWIIVSEFVRNELLVKGYWVSHFADLGLRFQTLPINGMLWIVWSVLLAVLLWALRRKCSFWETVGFGWASAFFMMWIVLFNLHVLPTMMLIAAIPLSLLEVVVGVLILQKWMTISKQ